MDFQQVIMRLNEYWADQGCLIWQPHNVQVGAGTLNPATSLRVLGPEPWNVAYVEPSVRPADGRYGENPNRWGQYFQYQVILQPEPGNPQELYLGSLRALGVDAAQHDVRFVEDNWASPALGAWGLGWEVWLDGQEITQFTYFQQAGGIDLDPVAVEITYGLERIVMVLQDVQGFNDIRWQDGVTYGDLLLRGEIEHCTYNFDVADVDSLHQMYDLCEAEAINALQKGLAMPAHDYVLKCSHIFNVLDARGAVGVTERARFFARMRDQSRAVARLYADQREELGYPLLRKSETVEAPAMPAPTQPSGDGPFDFVFEVGCEELPVGDLDDTIAQLRTGLEDALKEARLAYADLSVVGTPRRVVARIAGLAARQPDQELVFRGPAANIAYDADGNPTRAAQGFARGRGVNVEDLQQREIDGKQYVIAMVTEEGRDASAVLAEMLPTLVGALRYNLSMRWNESGLTFSRPLRWFVALLGDQVVPFEYAGIQSGRGSRGLRPLGSPDITIPSAAEYAAVMAEAGIMLDVADREASILEQARALAAQVGGQVVEDGALVREVANLVEYPLAVRGAFDAKYLRLPDSVLLATMRKHQRYMPVVKDGKLLPCFITIANGALLDVDTVRHGNEQVILARYADAAFFYDHDTQHTLADFTPRLSTLTFQERLGSVLDKVERLEKLVPDLGEMLGLSADELATAGRAAALCKSDLATQLVVELTSLQGQMGRHYAELAGESESVAQAIEEHYWPRAMGDALPESKAGLVVGLADRIDSLVGLFAAGIKATSASDPWGLRRTALGILQLLLGKELSLAVPEALSLAAELQPIEVSEDVLRDVSEFVTTRLRRYLLDAGYRYDAVEAVLGERAYDPFLAQRALDELIPWTEREDWVELLDSFARCVRITRDLQQVYPVFADKMVEQATRDLHAAYLVAAKSVADGRSVDGFFSALLELRPAITRFFDDVLVMDKNDELRENRLGLLQAISALTEGIVDLTVMEGF